MSVHWETMTDAERTAHCHAAVMLDGWGGNPTYCELQRHDAADLHRNQERKAAWSTDPNLMFRPIFYNV